LTPKFLYELQPGEWARINTIRMISSISGPVVVEANRSVIALGKGMARKIRIIKGR